MKKRIFSLALTLALCIGLFAGLGAPVMAADTVYTGDGYIITRSKIDGDCASGAQFGDGLLAVMNNGKLGYIDKNGVTVIPYMYAGARVFGGGFAFVTTDGIGGRGGSQTGYGIIDTRGNAVGSFDYALCHDGFREGFAAVSKGLNRFGIIDTNGRELLPCEYAATSSFSEGLAAVCKDTLYGYVDTSGNLVIPYAYDEAGSFNGGLAGVRKDGADLFIDKRGNVVFSTEYDTELNFGEGLACVSDSSLKYGFIDATGKVAIPFAFFSASNFKEGLARVADSGNKYGYIDKSGAIVIPCEYSSADNFNEGFAAVRKYDATLYTSLYGCIDTSGRLVLPLEYDYISPFVGGLAVARQNENCYIFAKVSTTAQPTPPTPTPTPDSMLVATPTASTVLVNGETVAFDAYNIGGNNYFKLRDLAYILSGTERQFEVAWDAENNAIALSSGQAYTTVGGEMSGKGAGDKTPTPTTSAIQLDGNDVQLTAYNIGGNNYFKLRDIGQAFDFGVDWDGANNAIVVDTSKGYTAE